jgi:hypothetical protein
VSSPRQCTHSSRGMHVLGEAGHSVVTMIKWTIAIALSPLWVPFWVLRLVIDQTDRSRAERGMDPLFGSGPRGYSKTV